MKKEDVKRMADRTSQSNNTNRSNKNQKSETRREVALPQRVPVTSDSGDMINKMISPTSDKDELHW